MKFQEILFGNQKAISYLNLIYESNLWREILYVKI